MLGWLRLCKARAGVKQKTVTCSKVGYLIPGKPQPQDLLVFLASVPHMEGQVRAACRTLGWTMLLGLFCGPALPKGCVPLCFCLVTRGFGRTGVSKAGRRCILRAVLVGGTPGFSRQMVTGCSPCVLGVRGSVNRNPTNKSPWLGRSAHVWIRHPTGWGAWWPGGWCCSLQENVGLGSLFILAWRRPSPWPQGPIWCWGPAWPGPHRALGSWCRPREAQGKLVALVLPGPQRTSAF